MILPNKACLLAMHARKAQFFARGSVLSAAIDRIGQKSELRSPVDLPQNDARWKWGVEMHAARFTRLACE